MKRFLRFSLTSFFVLIAVLSLLLAPLLARRNHVKFFHELEESGMRVRLEWHEEKDVPLDYWLGESMLQRLTRSKDWNISQQVETFTNYVPLPDDQLRAIGRHIPQCKGLIAVRFNGEIPIHFAKSLQQNHSLAILVVSESKDCQHISASANQISNLQALMFKQCTLTGTDMQNLESCDRLQFLAFVDSEIPLDCLETLRKKLPMCQVSRINGS